jgi:hypothetical protein
MLRKTIKFQDIDGVEQEEDFYFHLTKAELIKLEISLSQSGGLTENLQSIAKSKDPKLILQTFEELIRSAYGIRTPSGGFVKREEDWLEFKSSEAYSELFMELVTDGSYGAQFVAGIMPANMSNEVEQAVASLTETVELPQPTLDQEIEAELQEKSQLPAWQREGRDPTQAELRSMDQNELLAAYKAKLTGNIPSSNA